MRRFVIVLCAICCLAWHAQEEARASEWGCEVLLCAASDNPSWHSIASCRRPMEKLIGAMKRPGFSWPTCPEGGAGKPSYERYAECPAGWTASSGTDNRNGGGSADLSRCRRVVDECGQGRRGRWQVGPNSGDRLTRFFSDHNSCRSTELMARPLRDEPYYFDIRDDAKTISQRYYFSLNR